jgi:hypothetical protein
MKSTMPRDLVGPGSTELPTVESIFPAFQNRTGLSRPRVSSSRPPDDLDQFADPAA